MAASTEVKVGVFVLVGLAVLAYMTVRLGSLKLSAPEGYAIWAVFDHATGLKKGAPVEMAGIQIGTVKGIDLFHSRARVSMLIDAKVPIPSDSTAVIRTRGVLGDKYVSIAPGHEAAPRLKDGQRLVRAEVPTDLDQLMSRLGNIAEDVKVLTGSLKESLGSHESQQNLKESLANLKEITAGLKVIVTDNRGRLDQVVQNLQRFTADISQLSSENKQALAQTIQNFKTISSQLDATIGSLTSVARKIDKGQGTIGALVNDRKTLDDLNQTLDSLKHVAKKIDEGKGTLGRLVNDDTTVTRIDEALAGINDYLARGDAWRVYMEYRGEYLTRHEGLRSYVRLRLQPKADKYYLFGVVSDPVGRRTEKIQTTTTTENGVSNTVTEKTVTVDKDTLKFDAQFAKRIYDMTFRAGLFMTTGGVGVDYHLLNDDLKLTFEAFDFRTDYNPHLKLAADYTFWKYFYVTAGWDDFLSNSDGDSFFVGGGMTFYDDDLKFLLTTAPTP